MDRGYFRIPATFSLITLLIIQPAMAASPGAASRQAITHSNQSDAGQPKSVLGSAGKIAFQDGSYVKQVVGKQPGQRDIDPNRSLFPNLNLLPGRSSNETRRSTSQSTPPLRNGILSGLFSNSSNRGTSNRSTSSTSPRASRPLTNANRDEVDWQGIPYHQAHSTKRPASGPAPIRDPGPAEATMSPNQERPRLAETDRGPQTLPTPPELAPAPSSRRVVKAPAAPARVVSSRLKRDVVPNLSDESSSRRSGRRDLPQLDASEIAAAQAKPIPEEELVPKVSRRRIVAKTTPPKSEQPKGIAAAKKVSPAKPTPAVDVATKENVATKTETKKEASDTDQKVAANDAKANAGDPKQPSEPSSDDSATAAVETNVAAAPALSKPASSHSETNAVASKAEQMSPAVSAESTSIAAQQPAEFAKPSGPQFAPPRIPAPSQSAPIPAAPRFGPRGTVAGHHVGPPQTAFAPRGMTPGQPATSATATQSVAPSPYAPASQPVGSGVTGTHQFTPMPQQPNSRSLATQPPATPQLATPQPATPQPATLGTPTAATNAPPLPAPAAANIPEQPAMAAQATPVAGPTMRNNFDQNHVATSDTANAVTPEVDSGDTAVASELPGIRVVTHGPRSVIIRQTHEFEIRVENRGSIDASGVMIRAVIPDWAEVRGQNASRGDIENQVNETNDRLVWTIDSLPAGTSESMFVRLQAVRSGTHPVDVDWTLVPQKSVAKIEVREPKLDLVIEGPEEVVYGQSQTYKVRVLNPGDGIAPNVVFTLSPNSPTPQTQRIGDIPSGKEAQFEVELTAQDRGDLKIHGLAMGDLELKAEASKTIRVSAAELESVLSGPEKKFQGTNAIYHLELVNKGSATSEDIKASITLPAGVEYVGGIGIARQRGNQLSWPIMSLPPGATREYEFEVAMKAQGKKVLEFNAQGSAAGETKVALDTQVESISDLVMTIQDPMAPAPVGTEVVYEITIKNRGSRDAKQVRAIAQFSHGIEPRRIEGQDGQVLTGQVLFDPIPIIRAGEEIRIRVIAQADQAGHHRFRTEIRSGETVLVAEEATHYMDKRSERVSRRSVSSSSLR